MELPWPVHHDLAAADFIIDSVDVGQKRAMIYISELEVIMHFAREHVSRPLDDVIVGNNLIDPQSRSDVIVQNGFIQFQNLAFCILRNVEVIDGVAAHRGEGKPVSFIDPDVPVQGKVFNFFDFRVPGDPEHCHAFHWFYIDRLIIGIETVDRIIT